MAISKSPYRHIQGRDKFRSGLELNISKQLEGAKQDFTYEEGFLPYEIPSKLHRYTPDFILSNGIIVEGKGIFDVSDRMKHLHIQQQYPHLDIRFVFSNPNMTISKSSKTTYAKWCEKNGFKYAKGLIPVEWLKEKTKKLEGVIYKEKDKNGKTTKRSR